MFDPVSIGHQNAYFTAMAKGLQDKLFFLNSLKNIDTILDFGCADGRLLEAVAAQRPDLRLIGYDLDQSALTIAQKRVPSATFTASLDSALLKGRRVAFVASSVFHEVCSYGGDQAETAFWSLLEHPSIKTLAWRDMSLRAKANRPYDGYAIASQCTAWQVEDFQQHWGSLNSLDRILHFLLKEPWQTNWKREVQENYFPHPSSYIVQKVQERFATLTLSHHIPPAIAQRWKDRFAFVSPEPTHLQFLATRS